MLFITAAGAALAGPGVGPVISPAPVSKSGNSIARAEGASVIAYPSTFFAAFRPNTALDMVARLPGFTLDAGNTTIRGYAGAAGNVLIDGARPTSKADGLSDILARIPASQVERIDLVRGGAPGIDMQGLAIVANVIRRQTGTTQQTLIATGVLFPASGQVVPGLRYEASRQAGAKGWEFAAGLPLVYDDTVGKSTRVRYDSAGAVSRRERGAVETDGTGFTTKGSVKLPLAGGELRANANLLISDVDTETALTDVDTSSRLEVDDDAEDQSVEVGARYTRDFAARWNLQAIGLQKLAWSNYASLSRRGSETEFYDADTNRGESIVRGVVRYQPSPDLTLEGGAEAAFNFRRGRVSLKQNGLPVPVPSADVRVEERRGELFSNSIWRPTPSLGIEAGARLEFSKISQSGDTELARSFFYPKPRLLLSWSPTQERQLRLRVEREVGQLDFGQFVSSANLTLGTVAVGNPELEPDRRWVIEGAFEQRFWSGGALVLTLRHDRVSDVIDRVPFIGPTFAFDAPGNIGSATSNEAKVNLTLPLAKLGITGGELKTEAILRSSRVTDPLTGERRRISGQRPDYLFAEYRQAIPLLPLTVGLSFDHGREETYFRLTEVTTASIRDIVTLFGEYKITPQLHLFLEIANISPFTYERYREVYSGPRSTSPLRFAEDFDIRSQTRFLVRLRQTIGKSR